LLSWESCYEDYEHVLKASLLTKMTPMPAWRCPV